MPENLTPAEIWAAFGPHILGFGLKVLGALAVLIIGLRIASWLGNIVKRMALKRERIDDTLGNFFRLDCTMVCHRWRGDCGAASVWR